MKSNTSLIVAGAVGLAAMAGVSYGVINSRPADKPADVTIATPSPLVTSPITSSPSAASVPPVPAAKASAPAAEVRSPDPIASTAPPGAAASRQVESCTVTMVTVDDPNPPLNVRSTPSSSGALVGQLKNGLMVSVTAEQNGWFKVAEPAGWISAQRTKNGCNQKVERVSFGKGSTSATVSDRFIGGGSHRYLFNAGKGQRMTVSRNEGPFPTVRSANGQVLVQSLQNENRPQWSSNLAQTGDYVVEVESNFKGYPYSFSVAIE